MIKDFPQPITPKIFLEGLLVGLLTIAFGYIATAIIHMTGLSKNDMPSVCKDWNKNHVMELSLFFTGFLFHLTFEVTGLNKTYARNKIM
jgi:hypothetical protein